MPKKNSKSVSKEDLLSKMQGLNALLADDDEEMEESTEKNKQPSKESNEKKGPSKKTNTKKNLEALFADEDDDDDNKQEENKEKEETVENEEPEKINQVNKTPSQKKSNKDKKEDKTKKDNKKLEEEEKENELKSQNKNNKIKDFLREIDEEIKQEEEEKKKKESEENQEEEQEIEENNQDVEIEESVKNEQPEKKNNGRIAFFHDDDDEEVDEEKNIDKEKTNSLENKEPLNIFSESIDDENLDSVKKTSNSIFNDDEIEEEKEDPSKSELSPEKKEKANKIKELLGDDEEAKEESKLDQNMKKLNAIFSEGEDPKEMEDDLNFIKDKYINKPDDFETKMETTYLSVSDKIDDTEAAEEQKKKETEEKEKKEIEENQEKKSEEKVEGKEQESKKEEPGKTEQKVSQESSEKENDGPSVPQQSFKSMVSDFNKEHGTRFSSKNIDKYLKGKFDKCEGDTKAEQQKNFEKELHKFCNKAYANMLEKKGLQGKELTSGAFDNFNNFAKSLQQHCKDKGLLSKDFQIKEFGGMTPKEVKDIQLNHIEKLPQNQQQRTSKILAAGRKSDIKSMKNDLNESLKKVPNNGDGNGLENLNTKNALMSLRAAQHVHNGRSRIYKIFHPINNRRENNMIKDAMKQLTDKGYTIQDINQQLGKISGKDDLISQSVNEQKKTIDEMFERNSAKFEKQKEREAKAEEKKHGERISVPEADIAKDELKKGEKSKKIEPTLEKTKTNDGPTVGGPSNSK